MAHNLQHLMNKKFIIPSRPSVEEIIAKVKEDRDELLLIGQEATPNQESSNMGSSEL